MARLLILLLLVGGLLWFLHWFRYTPPGQVALVLRRVAIWGGIGLLVLATVTGRLNPIFAALAGALAVLVRLVSVMQMLPMLRQLLQSLGLGSLTSNAPGASTGGGQSVLRTRYLDMTLDHDSGAMDGSIREGPFAGQRLSDLTLGQLLRILELYQDSDAQSAAVLTAYLDRHHSPHGGPDWREAAADGGGEARHGAAAMTREEAYAVLGLAPGADAAAVRAAHRRLMQKLHPDRGGSDWLAAQINAAKRLLLGD